MAGGHGGTKGRRRGSPFEARRGERARGRRLAVAPPVTRGNKVWQARTWERFSRDVSWVRGTAGRLAGGETTAAWPPSPSPRPLAGSELGVRLASRPGLAVAPGLLVSLSRAAGRVCAQLGR